MSKAICTCHCGGSMFYKHLHDPSCDLFMHGEEAPQSKEAQLQAALDAEREKVAFLEKKNANLIEASNLVLKVKAEQDAQLATLQAQLAAAKKVKADYDRWLSGGVYFTTAEYEKHVADYGQQVQALQAQLRQVEGENELLKSGQRYMALGKERDTLRQLVEEADELYTHYGLLANPGYTGPINIFEWIGKVRAAKDAGKETDNGL